MTIAEAVFPLTAPSQVSQLAIFYGRRPSAPTCPLRTTLEKGSRFVTQSSKALLLLLSILSTCAWGCTSHQNRIRIQDRIKGQLDQTCVQKVLLALPGVWRSADPKPWYSNLSANGMHWYSGYEIYLPTPPGTPGATEGSSSFAVSHVYYASQGTSWLYVTTKWQEPRPQNETTAERLDEIASRIRNAILAGCGAKLALDPECGHAYQSGWIATNQRCSPRAEKALRQYSD